MRGFSSKTALLTMGFTVALAMPGSAATTLTFEGLANSTTVPAGALSGQGVSNITGATSFTAQSVGGSVAFLNMPSPSTAIQANGPVILDIPGGFTGSVTVRYSADSSFGQVQVFDGPGATGAVVGSSATLVDNRSTCNPAGGNPGDPGCWSTAYVVVAGTGLSIKLPADGGGVFFYDDLVYTPATLSATVVKAFTPSTVPAGATSVLSITITNPTSAALTNVSFLDLFPAGLVVASPAGVVAGCGGNVLNNAAGPISPGDTSIAQQNATVPPNSSCTVSANVKSDMAGMYPNDVSVVFQPPVSPVPSNTATLTVTGPPQPPTVTKSFSPNTVAAGGSTTLTITMHNPNSLPMTAAQLTDFLTGNLSGASITPVGCGPGNPTTLQVGGTVINLVNATIAANSDCVLNVPITAPTLAEVVTNTIFAASTQGTVAGTVLTATTDATAPLTVVGPPSVFKQFLPNTVLLGGSTQLSITVSNFNGASGSVLSNVAVSDTLPAGIQIATPNALAVSGCGGGTVTATAGTNIVTLTGATIQPSPAAQCVITLNVTGIQVGDWPNVTRAHSGKRFVL